MNVSQEIQKTLNHSLQNWDALPDSAQVRLPVVKALLGVSTATIWRLVSKKDLVTTKLTPRTTSFNVGMLRKFLAQKNGA